MDSAESADFVAFVTARMDRWRRAAYLLTRDWHQADDVVSVMVGKLYDGWRRISGVAENVDAYAQRMLTRAWLEERRRPWRRESPANEVFGNDAVPDSQVDEREALWQLLGSLGKRQQAVVVLRFYLDLSVEETAEILGIAPGTVKSQSSRALETLRKLATDVQGRR